MGKAASSSTQLGQARSGKAFGSRFPQVPSLGTSNTHDPTELNRPGTERDEMGAEERERDLMEEDRI